jgi:hypothetical protein
VDQKLKHMGWIQTTIGRLAHNSFTIKGWAVLTISAMVAIFINREEKFAILLAAFPVFTYY